MSKQIIQVNFRMPLNLKTALEEASVAAGRSLNAEIVHRLQASIDAPDEVIVINASGSALRDAVKQAMREIAGERAAGAAPDETADRQDRS